MKRGKFTQAINNNKQHISTQAQTHKNTHKLTHTANKEKPRQSQLKLSKQSLAIDEKKDKGENKLYVPAEGQTHAHTNTYKHIQTHTNTHKHTQTHTNTHKHTQTHTNTHKQLLTLLFSSMLGAQRLELRRLELRRARLRCRNLSTRTRKMLVTRQKRRRLEYFEKWTVKLNRKTRKLFVSSTKFLTR